MSLRILHARCKISDNKHLTVENNKNDSQDFDTITELPVGRQKLFRGAQKYPFGIFLFCECRRHDYLKRSGGMPQKKICKLTLNISNFSAFWNQF